MRYDDYSAKTKNELEKMGYFEDYKKLRKAQEEWHKEHKSDWLICEMGIKMEALGFKKYISRDTIYGNWGCTVFDTIEQKPIGTFCADAAMVCVLYLDEVLKYNSEYKDHIKNPDCVTLIKDFKGTVQFIVKEESGKYKMDIGKIKYGEKWVRYNLYIVGKGINKITGHPIQFESRQTSL